MREVLSTKEKREAVKRYIALNPELSNRKIAKVWDIGKETVRRYRAQLSGPNGSGNNQKRPKSGPFGPPQTDFLPVVKASNDVKYEPEKIRATFLVFMRLIVDMGKAQKYLNRFLPHQIWDAISERQSLYEFMDLYTDVLKDLEKMSQFFHGVKDERDARFTSLH
jgi:hypothetical protein